MKILLVLLTGICLEFSGPHHIDGTLSDEQLRQTFLSLSPDGNYPTATPPPDTDTSNDPRERIKKTTRDAVCKKFSTEILIGIEDSTNIDRNDVRSIKNHVKLIINRLELGSTPGKTGVGIFTFGRKTSAVTSITTKTAVADAINKLTFRRNEKPALLNAVKFASRTLSKQFSRKVIKKIFLHIGTGRSRSGKLSDLKRVALEARRNHNIHIFHTRVGTYDESSQQRNNIKAIVSTPAFRRSQKMEDEVTYERMQEIFNKDCYACHLPTLDIVFLFDHSSLITEKIHKQITQLLTYFLLEMEPENIGKDSYQHRMALVSYGQNVNKQVSFGLNKGTELMVLAQAFLELEFAKSENTSTAEALKYTLDQVLSDDMSRSRSKKIIMMITPTDIQQNQTEAIKYAKDARKKGIQTFVLKVNVTSPAGTDLTKLSGDKWHVIDQNNERSKVVKQIFKRFCYSVTYP